MPTRSWLIWSDGEKMDKRSFLQALGIQRGDVVCFTGAGGKTSLMFRLAQEAKGQGFKVLVTTSTKIFVPRDDQYDRLDLSGTLFSAGVVVAPGVYVGGRRAPVPGKMTGVETGLLSARRKLFDLVVIEADGAATKPLKGWHSTEPVVPGFTTKTIGIIDIQSVGRIICGTLVHRVEIFSRLTGGEPGEAVTTEHLCRVVCHGKGLFAGAQGSRILYINKVESDIDRTNVDALRAKLANRQIVAGSVLQGTIYGED